MASAKHSAASVEWELLGRKYLGVDYGEGRYSWICRLYETTERNVATGEIRNRIERGSTVYLQDRPDLWVVGRMTFMGLSDLNHELQELDAKHFKKKTARRKK